MVKMFTKIKNLYTDIRQLYRNDKNPYCNELAVLSNPSLAEMIKGLIDMWILIIQIFGVLIIFGIPVWIILGIYLLLR